MLKLTASAMRPAVLEGRVRTAAMTDAPGINKIVTTPGNGTSGEWTKFRTSEVTKAASNHRAVGATRGERLFTVGHRGFALARGAIIDDGLLMIHPTLCSHLAQIRRR